MVINDCLIGVIVCMRFLDEDGLGWVGGLEVGVCVWREKG